ncbi:MAG: CPBP family intramembrane metalloprotease [Oscillospiraceae bacterium]|nr:CPBP family intramembrane metalloprotease [Oscillospiraceae bacterium]
MIPPNNNTASKVAISLTLSYAYFSFISFSLFRSPLAVINIFLLPVTTALAEDGLYLGGGVGHIQNKYTAVIVPAFFYALQHCFIPTLFDVRYMVYRFASFLPLTVIFCIYFRKRREPLPVMISHVILDLATAVSISVTSLIPGAYEQMSGML